MTTVDPRLVERAAAAAARNLTPAGQARAILEEVADDIARAERERVLAEWADSDRRDVSAWLIREADQRVRYFPQRRDGVDALLRHLAASLRDGEVDHG